MSDYGTPFDNKGSSIGGIINADDGYLEQRFMEIPSDQKEFWHSDWKHRHPECERNNWALRIYHSTPDEQFLALYCLDCGKPVDPAEIINALIKQMGVE